MFSRPGNGRIGDYRRILENSTYLIRLAALRSDQGRVGIATLATRAAERPCLHGNLGPPDYARARKPSALDELLRVESPPLMDVSACDTECKKRYKRTFPDWQIVCLKFNLARFAMLLS
jgi:hypothetical protein